MAAFTFGSDEIQPTTNGNSPHVAALANGGYIVTWQGTGTGDDFGVFAQRYKGDGTAVGAPILVNTVTAAKQGAENGPSVVGLAGGGVVVVWDNRYDVSGSSLRAQILNADGTKLGAEMVIDSSVPAHMDPTVAALNGGGFVVGWNDTNKRAQFQIYSATGTAQGSLHLISSTPGKETAVAVSALNAGRFVATWQENVAGGDSTLWLRLFDATGTAVSKEIQITDNGGEKAPSVAALPNGGFLLAWQSDSGDTHKIRVQSYTALGVKVGNPITVSTNTTSVAPKILALNDGGFFVSWSQVNNGTEIVAGRSYSSTLVPDSDPKKLNVVGVSGATPDAALLASGRIVVA